MALWGISTTQEAADNNYAIPKWFNDSDRSFTPHNCFADERGWLYRRYQSDEQSGLSTVFYDELIAPVAGLNTTGYGATDQNMTGLGTATPVAIFFEDPNKNNPISVSAGGTDAIGDEGAFNIHLVYNENVFCGTGATVKVRTFDVNQENESTPIIAYSTRVTQGAPIVAFANTDGIVEYTSFDGQICNRISFAGTAPGTLLEANYNFNVTTASAASGIGSTTFYPTSLKGIVAGVSSVTINTNQGIGKTNAPIGSVGSTSFTVGRPGITTAGFSTIRDQIPVGVGATITFSNLTAATKLKINMDYGIVGTVTSFYDSTAAVKTFINAGVATRPNAYIQGIDRQVGGAGTFMSGSFLENPSTLTVDGSVVVGLGTTALLVGFADTTF